MRKIFTLKTILLLLVAFVTTGAWADEVTFTYSDYKGNGTSSSGSDYTMDDKNYVSIGSTKFYGNNSYSHFYASSLITVTPKNGATVTSVSITTTSTSYNGYQSSGSFSTSTGTMSKSNDGLTVTWSGSSTSAFTITNTKQVRWTSIVVTYSAASNAQAYKVTLNAGDNGSCSTSSLTESKANAGVTLPSCTANEGYAFLGWSTSEGGSVEKEAGDTYKPTADETLYAVYAALYTATIVDPANGTVSVRYNGESFVSGTQLPVGAVLNVTATAADGYKFRNLQIVDASTHTYTASNTKDWTMGEHNITITANFDEIVYNTITWSVNGNTSVIPASSVENGTAITFPTDIEDLYGKKFVGWSASESASSAGDLVSGEVNASEDATYYAVYATVGVPSLEKLDGSYSFESGDNIVIVAEGDGFSKSLYQETVSTSYVKYEDFTNSAATINADSKRYYALSSSNGKWKIGDAVNGYLYNNTSNNLTCDTQHSTEWSIVWDSKNEKFTIKSGTRWLSCRSDLTGDNQYKFRGGGTGNTPQTGSVGYLDIYLFSEGSYSDYCTTVEAPTSVACTVGKYKYATFSSEYALDLDGMTEGFEAYKVVSVVNDVVTTEKVDGTVAANNGLIIKGTAEGECVIPVVAEGADVEGNLLVASNGSEVPAGAYVLGVSGDEVKFLRTSEDHKATLAAGKSYLPAQFGNARALRFAFSESTGITNVATDAKANVIYNIAGQRVSDNAKGLVIINGKKYNK